MEGIGSFKVIFRLTKSTVMQEQNLKNHSQMVPLYHYVLSLVFLGILIGSILKFYRNYQTGLGGLLLPALLILISIAIFLVAMFARTFALRAQDRAIRAEENLRYFAITGKLLDTKLSIQQIVALRFAPNNEFPDLAHRAVEENMHPKEIKKAIKHWKGDYYRV